MDEALPRALGFAMMPGFALFLVVGWLLVTRPDAFHGYARRLARNAAFVPPTFLFRAIGVIFVAVGIIGLVVATTIALALIR